MAKIQKKTVAEKAKIEKEKELAKAKALIEKEAEMEKLNAEQAIPTPQLNTNAVAAASTAPVVQPAPAAPAVQQPAPVQPGPGTTPAPAAPVQPAPAAPVDGSPFDGVEDVAPAQEFSAEEKADIEEGIDYFNKKYSSVSLPSELVPNLLYGILQELRKIKEYAKD